MSLCPWLQCLIQCMRKSINNTRMTKLVMERWEIWSALDLETEVDREGFEPSTFAMPMRYPTKLDDWPMCSYDFQMNTFPAHLGDSDPEYNLSSQCLSFWWYTLLLTTYLFRRFYNYQMKTEFHWFTHLLHKINRVTLSYLLFADIFYLIHTHSCSSSSANNHHLHLRWTVVLHGHGRVESVG